MIFFGRPSIFNMIFDILRIEFQACVMVLKNISLGYSQSVFVSCIIFKNEIA